MRSLEPGGGIKGSFSVKLDQRIATSRPSAELRAVMPSRGMRTGGRDAMNRRSTNSAIIYLQGK